MGLRSSGVEDSTARGPLLPISASRPPAAGRRSVPAASVCLVCALGSSAARADAAPQFNLRWLAPAGCASVDQVRASVLELAGTDVPAPVNAYASIKHTREGFHLSLVTYRAGQRGQRELAAPTCAALVEAVTVILAIAIDPELLTRSELASAEPLRVDAPAPEAASLAAPKTSPGGDAAQAPAQRPGTPPPELVAEDRSFVGNEGFASGGGEGSSTQVLASLAGAVESGTMPGLGFGFTARVGGRFGRYRLETQLSRYLSRRATGMDPSKGAELTISSVGMWACFRAIPGRELGSSAPGAGFKDSNPRIEAGPCLGAELGQLDAIGFGIASPARGRSSYAGAGGALRLGATANPWLSLDLRLEGVMLLHRPTFVVDELGPVHRPDAWSLRASLGAEVSFP